MLVVSDHGAKRMDGGIRVNEWLRGEGLLHTRARAAGRLARCATSASTGAARPPGARAATTAASSSTSAAASREGTVAPEDYERVRDELAERLAAIPDDDGEPIATRVYKPEEVYDEVNGIAPDLIVYFGDLAWRSVGTIGGDEGVHTFENDTGPDDANHAQDGLLIMAGPGSRAGSGARGCSLLDVAPTVLELLGLEPPAAMRGTSLLRSEELSRPR